MALFSFGARKPSPSHADTKPSMTPVSSTKWARLKSRLSGRKNKEVMDTKIVANTRASIEIPPNEPERQKIFTKTPSFTRSGAPPDLPTTASLSLGNELLRSRTKNSGNHRSSSPDSQVAPSRSEYNYLSLAPSRANILGVAGLAENHALPSTTEEDESARYEAEFSELPAPISSSSHTAPKAAVRFVEGIQRSTFREFEPEPALELFISSSLYEDDYLSACLSSGTEAQSRRSRLRSQQAQPTMLPREPADQFLAPTRRTKLSPTGFAENDDRTANSRVNESAVNEARPSSLAAPIYPTSLQHQKPKKAARLTPILEPVSKDAMSIVLSSSLRGEDERNESDFSSKRRRPGAPANQASTSTCEPANRPFHPARGNGLNATASAENNRRSVDPKNVSARGEVGSSTSVAPIRSEAVSTHRNSRLRQQGQVSTKATQSSTLAIVNNLGVTDPGENDRRPVDTNNESARGEATSSVSVAPIRSETGSNHQGSRSRPQNHQISTRVASTFAHAIVNNVSATTPGEQNRRTVHTKNESARGEVRSSASVAPIRSGTVSNYPDSRPRSQDHQISTKVTQSSALATANKARTTDSFGSSRRAVEVVEGESARGEARPSSSAAPIDPTPLSHRKTGEFFRISGGFLAPPVWTPGPRRPTAFKSRAVSSLQEGVQKSKSSESIIRSSAESEATRVPQSAQDGESKPRSRPHDIRQTSAQDADAPGATSIGWLRTRCALHHPEGSPSELQALQANARPEKVLEWLNSPVPIPFLNLGNDGVASETTVFTSQGPLIVSYVEEQLRWWSQCSCSNRYAEWTRFAVLARYSIGPDFCLTPIRRPPPKTDFKTKLITYFRKS